MHQLHSAREEDVPSAQRQNEDCTDTEACTEECSVYCSTENCTGASNEDYSRLEEEGWRIGFCFQHDGPQKGQDHAEGQHRFREVREVSSGCATNGAGSRDTAGYS